jgi:hypothetical protein
MIPHLSMRAHAIFDYAPNRRRSVQARNPAWTSNFGRDMA